MKSLLKFIVFIIILVPLVIIALAAYFGFVPVASNILGATKPKDLGVTYKVQDFTDYLSKSKSAIVESKTPVAGDKSIGFSGSVALDTTFSQEEISSRLNYSKWKYMPVTNTQLRINSDGSVEFSGNLATTRLAGFIQAIGGVNYSQEEVNKALDILNKLSPNPPVYVKFIGSASNNHSAVSVSAMQIGRLSVPLDKLGGNAAVEALVDHVFSITPGFNAESVSFSGGKMNFKGTAPTKIMVQTSQ